jgi:hypothetical protein
MNYFQFYYFCGALLLSTLAYMSLRLFAVKWLIILKSLLLCLILYLYLPVSFSMSAGDPVGFRIHGLGSIGLPALSARLSKFKAAAVFIPLLSACHTVIDCDVALKLLLRSPQSHNINVTPHIFLLLLICE